MSKKTVYTEDNSTLFVNPYNFVGFSNKSVKTNDDNKGHLTGYLECCLKTKTPLIILDSEKRETETTNKGDHYSYPFLRIKETPTIPGSQLRGMVRNIYETITNSCFSSTQDSVLGARMNDFNSKPGILEKDANGKWQLFEAERYRIRTHADKPNKSPLGKDLFEVNDKTGKIKINGTEYSNFDKIVNFGFTSNDKGLKYVCENGTHYATGYLLLTPRATTSKIYDSIMVKKGDKALFTDNEKIERALSGLKKSLEAYQKFDESEKKEERKANPKYDTLFSNSLLENASAIPVWYRTIEGKFYQKEIYLFISQQGRITFNNTVHKLLGKHKPCDSSDSLCPACSLFGMVGANNEAHHGLVRFSDATTVDSADSDIFLKPVTLSELAQPHLTAIEFYTKRPSNCDYWNFDFSKGNNTYYVCETIIRGRKFYWHHQPIIKNEDKTNLNETVEPMKSGKEFSFKVYFNQINERQLSNLIWSLNLGENNGESKCHKLGHAKPLGYGSVKVTVKGLLIRKIEQIGNRLAYSTDFGDINSYCNSDIEQYPDIKEQLLKICDFEVLENCTVHYPIAEDKTDRDETTNKASYHWFVGNRTEGANKVRIKNTLPNIADQKLTLPKIEKKYLEDNNRSFGSNNNHFRPNNNFSGRGFKKY